MFSGPGRPGGTVLAAGVGWCWAGSVPCGVLWPVRGRAAPPGGWLGQVLRVRSCSPEGPKPQRGRKMIFRGHDPCTPLPSSLGTKMCCSDCQEHLVVVSVLPGLHSTGWVGGGQTLDNPCPGGRAPPLPGSGHKASFPAKGIMQQTFTKYITNGLWGKK